LVLVSVEVALALKPAAIVCLAFLVISGIGPGLFSFSGMISRGIPAMITLITGILAGAALAPALLPQLPGTMFSVKGISTGLGLSIPTALVLAHHTGFYGVVGLILTATALSSYLAMNFTGTSPYTSPTGVEKEMRRFIPIQAGAFIVGTLLWIVSAF
ncbi:MAG: mercury methylation corrinoid protein HgcA, partial [Desulfobacteraceae bacterium]|nr:mercury methylation corrinoid protein HgcA [Desulfobacteraceae bacterium]